jgi:hypothetical protein
MLSALRTARPSGRRWGQPPAVFRLLPGGPAASLCARGELAGSYGETLTFSRASAKYAESGAGVLTALTNNQPGVEPRGLLIEAAATNLCLHSAALDNASWVKAGGVVAAPTVTANAGTAPDGTLAAERVEIPSTAPGGAFSRVGQSANLTAASYTFSVWIRGRSGSGSTYLTAFIAATGLNPATTLINYTTTWQRFSLTFTATAVSWHMMIGTDAVNAATGHTDRGAVDIEVWGAQVESGIFASSYIATAGTTATRVAESARFAMPASLSGSNWAVGLTVEPRLWTSAGARVLFQTDNAYAAANHVSLYVNTTGTLQFDVFDNATAIKSMTTNAAISGTRLRLVATCENGTLALWVDGAKPAQTAGGAGTGVITTWPANFYVGTNRTTTQCVEGYIHSFALGSSYGSVR